MITLFERIRDFIKTARLKPGTQLQPHQIRVIEKLKKSPGLIVYHGLGSGKTLASIAASEALGGRANVVVPAALRENYRKEIASFVDKPDTKYDIKSYEQAARAGLSPSDVTVFDEAHRLGRLDSKRSALAKAAPGKVVFLTGTPVRNEPAEILPLLHAVAKDRRLPKSREEFNKRFIGKRLIKPSMWARLFKGIKPGEEQFLQNKYEIANLVRGRVDFHPSNGEFPTMTVKQVPVNMSDAQTNVYNGLLNTNPMLAYKVRRNLPPNRRESSQLNAFLAGIRQASNDPSTYDQTLTGLRPIDRSPKYRQMFGSIVGRIKQDPNFKGVVYSNYLKSGVEPLAQELAAAKVPSGVFHGGLSDSQRKQLVNDYNSGKLKVLLISGAGSEGLDLKGTKLVQIMEPHWNDARIRQVIGRAVRNRSHAHLPENERHVEVEQFEAQPLASKSKWLGFSMAPKYEMGADRYMYNLSTKKQKLVDEMLDIFKSEGSQPSL